MSNTKKDFEAVAAILKAEQREVTSPNSLQTIDRLAHRFAQYFANQNPRFDNARFLKACGVTE